MFFVYIVSGLALLAACMSLCVACKNEKRSKKRNTAMLRYVEATASNACDKAAEKANDAIRELDEHLSKVEKICNDLSSGILPDYEQAKAAANAVNDFSRGISNILGFDPMQALAEQREKDKGGGGE